MWIDKSRRLIDINMKTTNETTTTINRVELDTAAQIFPLVFADDYKSLVRFNVVMRDKFTKSNLKQAFKNLVVRFPTFFVKLRRDRRNYYFETLLETPKIVEDEQLPFSTTLDDLYNFAFKIAINGNNLAFEFFHAISDGYGASVFLKTLLAEYVRIEYGVVSEYDRYLLNPQEQSKLDETSDDLSKITTTKIKTKAMESAYRIIGKTNKKYNITTLTYSTSELKKCAKKYDVSLTALLSAVLARSLAEIKSLQKSKGKEIKLSIPVDLRRRFESNTLRNFSIPTTIKVEKKAEKQNLFELSKSFDEQIKSNLNLDNLQQMVTMYVKLAYSKTLAKLPLSLKRFGVRRFYSLFKNTTTMTLTNFGIFSVPSNLKPYIEKINASISPKSSYPCTCAIVTFGDTLSMTLTSSLDDDLLETAITREISALLAHNKDEGMTL